MAFTREDYDDLIKMVLESPELSERMRFALFGQAFSALPADVQAIRITLSEVVATQRESAAQIKMLAEAQKRTEEQVAKLSEEVRALTEAQNRTDAKVAELAEAQKRTEEQVAKLSEEVRALTEAQKRTDAKVAELSEAQKRTEAKVAELAEAQKRTEEQVAKLSEEVRALTEAQKRTDAKVAELSEAQKRTDEKIAELIEAQKRTDQKIAELVEAQKRTDQKIAELIKAQKHLEEQVAKLTEEMRVIVRRLDALTDSHYKLESRVNRLTGMVLEINYERKAQARFGRLLRKARVVEWNVLEDLLAGLSPEETEELSEIDLVVQGIWRQNPQYQVFLAIEISGKIEAWDVKRALERTKLMRKAGLLTLPVVAGEEITHEAKSHAKEQGVIVIMDGSMKFIEEALHRHPLSP
jgi:septal ring factor EnvC (AmiA/AmiB activator)